MSPDLVVALVGVGLAVVALVYANHTDRGVGQTLVEVREALDRLRDVREGLSTRSLGGFPSYFETIVELLERAEHKVDVLCDLPAYGAFSSPDVWIEYHNRLLELTKRSRPPEESFRLRIACLSAPYRDRLLNEQFSPDEWQKLLSEPAFRRKLNSFRDRHWRGERGPLTDRARLVERLLDFQVAEHRCLETADVDSFLPLYCWIADDHRAVFAVASLPKEPSEDAASGTTREVGFETSDSRLIDALRAVFEQYWLAAPRPVGE